MSGCIWTDWGRAGFARELEAVLWAGNQQGLEEGAEAMAAKALRFLVAGFRARLAEIGGGG